MDEEEVKKYLKGTTTLGFVCKDGVVLASDTRATMGYLIADKESPKIFRIDDKIAVTTAGMVGDNQALVRIMKAQLALYKLEGKPITVKSAATLLANILHSMRVYPFLAQLIVGGLDTEGRIFELDPVGGMTEKKYSSSGSGSPVAYGVLETGYYEDILVEDGIKLAIKGVKAALERDCATGNYIRVMTIKKDGVKEYSKEEIEKIMSELGIAK